jgi:hypothetical protein
VPENIQFSFSWIYLFIFYKVKLHSLTQECIGALYASISCKGTNIPFICSAKSRIYNRPVPSWQKLSARRSCSVKLSRQRGAMTRFASPVPVKGNMSHFTRSSNSLHERFLFDALSKPPPPNLFKQWRNSPRLYSVPLRKCTVNPDESATSSHISSTTARITTK